MLCLLAMFVMLLTPQGAWAQDYILTVAGHGYTADDLLNAQTVTGDGIDGTVTITPASGDDPVKLTLNEVTISGSIVWDSSDDLTVNLVGNSSIFGFYPLSTDPVFKGNGGALLFTTNVETPGSLYIGVTSQMSYFMNGWNTTTSTPIWHTDCGNDPLEYIWYVDQGCDYMTLGINRVYNLWINGTQLCSANKGIDMTTPNEGIERYISFDGDCTLTINNFSYNCTSDPFIKNGVGDLIVFLQGENALNCGQLFLGKNDGDDDHNVTFMTNEYYPGTLVITTTGGESDAWYTGHNTPTITDLLFTDEMIEGTRTLTFSEPISYGLKVGDKRVTSANPDDILGDGKVSFDADNNILTLNNATIDLTTVEYEGSGIRYTGSTDLTIELIGTNSIKTQGGCEPILFDAEQQTAIPVLTFENGSTQPCSLELLTEEGTSVIKGFSNVSGVNGIGEVTGNLLKLVSEDEDFNCSYSEDDGLYTLDGNDKVSVSSVSVVFSLSDPKFCFSDSENSGIPDGGTMYYAYGEEQTLPVLKRWDDGYLTDLSGFNITYTSSDENVATISDAGVITIVGGGWAEIRASIAATNMYEADEAWFTMEVRPADPDVSLSEGAYYTGQKLTLTRVGQSGSLYYSYGSKEASERTAYEGEISLPAGTYDFYPYTRCGTEEQNIWSYGNAHRMLYVFDEPVISKDAGEYEGDIEVEITGLPESASVTTYYYFGDDEENAEVHVYTAGSKIAVSESTKLNVYLFVEGDSGKKYKTPVVERQYVIKDITLAVTADDFHDHWTTYYNANGNVAIPENQNIGAFVATAVGESSVTVTQINRIPKGEPVLLNNETTTTTDNTSVTGNMLRHADEDVDADTDDAVYYGLYNGAMMRVSGTIPAGKNYLYLPQAMTQPKEAPKLTIVIDGETTGIGASIVNSEEGIENGDVYDLTGRKVQKPSKKGLYVNKGRKVVVK